MKSEIEKQFDAKVKEYTSKFGKSYPILVTESLSFAEHIERIDGAIKSDTPIEIKLDEGAVY